MSVEELSSNVEEVAIPTHGFVHQVPTLDLVLNFLHSAQGWA
jgi:hypothetical protein